MGSPQAIRPFDEDPDRREAKRSTALFRPALLGSEDFRSFCLVRNISSTGMMASVHAPLRTGQAISIRFDEAVELSGKVVWRVDDRLGVEFHDAVDVDDLLMRLGARDRGQGTYRSPRLEIEVSGQFLTQGNVWQIDVRDVSQRGLKAKIDWASVCEGEEGTVALVGLQPRPAVIRWVRNGLAGLYFLEPIGFSELGQWVWDHHQRTKMRLCKKDG